MAFHRQSMDEFIRLAGSAEGEELWRAIRINHSSVLMSATNNRALTDDQALFIARSRNSPPEALGFLAGDVRFNKSYKVMLALCRNPRTPQRVAITLLKNIKLFDLADITRNHYVNSVVRQKVEVMLMDRVPSLPMGVKMALSRRANTRVVMKIMEKGDRRVIDSCLEGPLMTEDELFRMVQRTATKALVIRAIAEHPRWGLRYRVRYALVRNFHCPTAKVEEFVGGLKTSDLRDLYADSHVPTSNKPFIHAELVRRNEPVDIPEDVVHELTGEEGLSDREITGMISDETHESFEAPLDNDEECRQDVGFAEDDDAASEPGAEHDSDLP